MLPLLATITVDGLDKLSNAGSGMSWFDDLIPLTSIVLSLGMPIIIVFLVLLFKHRRQKLQNEVVLKLAEKGQPIPHELFLEPQRRTKSDLSSGLTLIGIGAGLAVAFYMMDNEHLAGFALIPLFIGLARLISWKIEQGQKNG